MQEIEPQSIFGQREDGVSYYRTCSVSFFLGSLNFHVTMQIASGKTPRYRSTVPQEWSPGQFQSIQPKSSFILIPSALLFSEAKAAVHVGNHCRSCFLCRTKAPSSTGRDSERENAQRCPGLHSKSLPFLPTR